MAGRLKGGAALTSARARLAEAVADAEAAEAAGGGAAGGFVAPALGSRRGRCCLACGEEGVQVGRRRAACGPGPCLEGALEAVQRCDPPWHVSRPSPAALSLVLRPRQVTCSGCRAALHAVCLPGCPDLSPQHMLDQAAAQEAAAAAQERLAAADAAAAEQPESPAPPHTPHDCAGSPRGTSAQAVKATQPRASTSPAPPTTPALPRGSRRAAVTPSSAALAPRPQPGRGSAAGEQLLVAAPWLCPRCGRRNVLRGRAALPASQDEGARSSGGQAAGGPGLGERAGEVPGSEEEGRRAGGVQGSAQVEAGWDSQGSDDTPLGQRARQLRGRRRQACGAGARSTRGDGEDGARAEEGLEGGAAAVGRGRQGLGADGVALPLPLPWPEGGPTAVTCDARRVHNPCPACA
jgi:hypothetical protein